MAFYVYIIRCCDGSYYTGYTRDIVQRVEEHNKGKASKYTSSRRPVELIYSESHATKGLAMKREIEIKGWNRMQKQTLIDGNMAGSKPSGEKHDR